MTQEVLYRRWRPQRFADVAGQEPVTTTLRHAVAAASPAHAYLFSGPRGTGKTSTGRILAKAVNCLEPGEDGEPDNACQSCEAFSRGSALDLIELDAASNRGIDEIRELREAVGYVPANARYKVYLIDEVHMLTDAAFNALLKTLEEPPPHVIFVLATTEPHRIPATILSRCQRFDFRRIPLADTVERLHTIGEGEGLTVADGGLELIARQATGSLRDAVNLLDQLVAYHGRELSLEAVRGGLGLVVDDRAGELARASVARDLRAGLDVLDAARSDGIEIRALMRAAVVTLRSALLLKAGGGDQLGLSESEAEQLKALAGEGAAVDIVAALRALGSIDFAGDAYDALPAEIAFAMLAVGLGEEAPAAAAPPQPAAAAPPRSAAAPVQPQPQRSRRPSQPRGEAPRRLAEQAAPAASPAATASRPAAASGSFVPPDEGELSPQLVEVRGKWEAIRAAARKRHHKAGALLNTPCNIKSFDGDKIELGFRFPVHVEQVMTFESGKVMQAISEAVVEAVGRPVEVAAVVWEQLEQARPAVSQRSQGGHLVDEARKQGAESVEE